MTFLDILEGGYVPMVDEEFRDKASSLTQRPINALGRLAWLSALLLSVIGLAVCYGLMILSGGPGWPYLFPSVPLGDGDGRLAACFITPLVAPPLSLLAGLRFLVAELAGESLETSIPRRRQAKMANNASLVSVLIGAVALVGVVAFPIAVCPTFHFLFAGLFFFFMSLDAAAQLYLDLVLGPLYALYGPRVITAPATCLAAVATLVAEASGVPEAMTVTELSFLLFLGLFWFQERHRFHRVQLAVTVRTSGDVDIAVSGHKADETAEDATTATGGDERANGPLAPLPPLQQPMI